MLSGADILRVDWYPSLGAAMRGFEKNIYPNLNYSLLKAAAAIGLIVCTIVTPYIAIWKTQSPVRLLWLAGIVVNTGNFMYTNRLEERPTTAYLWTPPITGLITCCAILRSAWTTRRQGGIRWRDTLYPLDQLRTQTGLEGAPRSGGMFTRSFIGLSRHRGQG